MAIPTSAIQYCMVIKFTFWLVVIDLDISTRYQRSIMGRVLCKLIWVANVAVPTYAIQNCMVIQLVYLLMFIDVDISTGFH